MVADRSCGSTLMMTWVIRAQSVDPTMSVDISNDIASPPVTSSPDECRPSGEQPALQPAEPAEAAPVPAAGDRGDPTQGRPGHLDGEDEVDVTIVLEPSISLTPTRPRDVGVTQRVTRWIAGSWWAGMWPSIGGKWPGVWLWPLRPWVALLHRPFVRDFVGFDQPWRLLNRYVPDLEIRDLAAGSGYLATGHARGPTLGSIGHDRAGRSAGG
jgi:hypothetical protein